MRHPLVTFLRENLTLGNRLSEWFYGVVMVAAITGLINTGFPPDAETLRYMLIAALGVNVAWGIIDGVTSMYSGLVNRADYLSIANAFRGDRGDPEKRGQVAKMLQGTIVENLPPEEQEKVVDMIGAGDVVTGMKYPATRADWNVAIAIILIDFILIFPVVIPFIVMENVRLAVLLSHSVAIVLVALNAAIWAKYLGLNMVKSGAIIAVISWIALIFTYIIGW